MAMDIQNWNYYYGYSFMIYPASGTIIIESGTEKRNQDSLLP